MVRPFLHGIRRGMVHRIPSVHHEHGMYKWWVLFNVMIGTFMAVLDATIVNVALPKIMATFGVTIDKVEWVVTAYLLVFAVMLPTSGWVADHLGYKRTYFFALFLFTVGSFLCGMAWDENILIVFRVIQGAGAGFLMPVGMAIVTREFPPHQRGIALGFWSIAAAASVSLGPLIGGYLVDNISWHAIFDVNVPVGIVAMFATFVIQREYRTEQTRSFDVVGFVSMSLFLSFLLLALTDGNASWNTGGWTSPFIISCFVISSVSFVVFMVAELVVRHPLIELRLLKNFNFGVTNTVLFIFGLGMFGSTFLLPVYLQNALGYTALQAGAMFLPVGILQAITAPIAGIVSDRVNPKIPAAIGLILLALSLYLNGFLSLWSEHSQIMLPLYLRGLAMGMLFTPLSTLALMEIPRHKMAQASGMFNVIRQIGGSFGVAIMGTLLTTRTAHHVALYGQSIDPGSPEFARVSGVLMAFARVAAGGTPAEAAARAKALLMMHVSEQAFVDSINDDFLIAAAITIVGLIPIFLLRNTGRSRIRASAME
jgi:MFS transporter, DHA2 family, multidrug resistance protein